MGPLNKHSAGPSSFPMKINPVILLTGIYLQTKRRYCIPEQYYWYLLVFFTYHSVYPLQIYLLNTIFLQFLKISCFSLHFSTFLYIPAWIAGYLGVYPLQTSNLTRLTAICNGYTVICRCIHYKILLLS